MESGRASREAILDRIRRANETLPEQDFPYPLYVIVEPTNVCNLSCAMCPSRLQTRPRGVMALALWQKIMDEVADRSPSSVIWPAIMGEALTDPDAFVKMLAYGRGKGLDIIWNTNALLLDDHLIDEILALELREIIIGADAMTKETYEKIRVGGDFDAMMRNVHGLLERRRGRTRVTLQFIEQEANATEREDFKQYWLSHGAVVKIRPRLGWGNGVDAPDLVLAQSDRIGPCPWLIRTVSIHWNGIVVQCDGDWDQKHPVGDLTKESLESIWRGELARRRQRHRQGEFDFEPCNACCDWQAGLSDFYFPEEAPSA